MAAAGEEVFETMTGNDQLTGSLIRKVFDFIFEINAEQLRGDSRWAEYFLLEDLCDDCSAQFKCIRRQSR